MCFKTEKSNEKDPARDLGEYALKFPERFKPQYLLSAFANDYLPVYRTAHEMEFFSWGFIQPTKYDTKESAEIKYMTANAKAETIFEKPLYKEAIHERRCIIVINGFYEWRHAFGKKYPHYIYAKDKLGFYIGGIWNEFTNVETGEIKQTVSMITTAANPMMEVIHNTKKRMPFILDRSAAFDWIKSDLKPNHINELMTPYDETHMAYHTVGRRPYPNSAETILPVVYPELANEQQLLF